MKNVYTAAVDGFKLTLRRLDLLIIVFIFDGMSYAFSYLSSAIDKNIFVGFLSLCLTLISLSYSISIPYFLSKQKSSYTELKSVVLKNAKRLIKPMLIIMAVFGVGALASVSMLSANEMSGNEIITLWTNIFSNMNSVFHPSAVILRIFAAMFTFTSIYFSIKNMSFFASMQYSFSFSYRHMAIVVTLFTYLTLVTALNSIWGKWVPLQIVASIVQIGVGYYITTLTYSYFIASSKH
ncbi:MAG: hypothetical protein NUV52_04615 [Candidatus Roizmanbacteria bacterium]|nr:hypothetical protein [Candidatus Roizmanbacteria bacterium]